jgi:hypothetical protein
MWKFKPYILRKTLTLNKIIDFLSPMGEKIPILASVEDFMPYPRRQGTCGSCTSFAVVQVLEYIMIYNGLLTKKEHLSERFLHIMTLYENKIHMYEECGINIEEAIETAFKYGIPLEKEFPYYKSIFHSILGYVNLQEIPSKEVIKTAGRHKISSYKMLSHNKLLINIKYAILNRFPVIVVIKGSDGMFSWSRGEIDASKITKDFWYHACIIVAYNELKEELKFQNTWDGYFIKWGDGGFGYIKYSDINTVIVNAWTLTGITNTEEDREELQLIRQMEGLILE